MASIITVQVWRMLPLATVIILAGLSSIPQDIHDAAAVDGAGFWRHLFQVTLPAILPQLLTALRVASGVAWMVVVAAEMIAVRTGLGFLIIDARNGLRMDLVVVGMITIGVIGVGLDMLFSRLARHPAVRWGYDR